jgi:hypothetical protein
LGLGLLVASALPQRGLLGRPMGRDALWSAVREAIASALTDPLVQALVEYHAEEHTLFVNLHPAGEPLRFTWDPRGAVQAESKTSTAGPGYHAFCVDLLESIAEDLGLSWNWQDPETGEDETGYALSRDFPGLQGAMAEWLKATASALLRMREEERAVTLAVNMPLGYPTLEDGPASPRECAVTPMGPISREWLLAFKTADRQTLARLCHGFFPWWARERDARYWLNCGRILTWMDVPWRRPNTEREARTYRLVLDCFARARELDPGLALPVREIEEMRDLCRPEPSALYPPAEQGMGYRRRLMRHPLAGGWSIAVPGYYVREDDDEGVTMFWFAGRTVRLSSLTIEGKHGQAPSPDSLLAEAGEEDALRGETFEFDEDHVKGRAAVQPAEEEGRRFWMLQGCAAATGSLAIVTVCFDAPGDKTWAVDTFRSLRRRSSMPAAKGGRP